MKSEHYFTANPKSEPRLGLIRTTLLGRRFEFLTSSGIFSKEKVDLGTRLLIENMILPEKGCVLDMGCGYGPIGIAAAIMKPLVQVLMTDVNVRAVRLARKNIELNKAWNATVKHGKLYEPVKDKCFGCILSNPPVSAGMETVQAIVREAPNHLALKGHLQMVMKSKVAGKRLSSIFEDAFGNVSILARGSGYRILMSEKG